MSYESIRKAIEEAKAKGNVSVNNSTSRVDEIKAAITHAKNTGFAKVDGAYIKSFVPEAMKFVDDAANKYEGFGYAGHADAYSDLKKNIDKYKSGLYLSQQYLKNNNPDEYANLEKYFTDLGTRLDKIDSAYASRNDMYSKFSTEDEYNAASTISKYAESTFDDIKRAIAELSGRQRRQSQEESAKTQKQIDVLNELLYTNTYKDDDSLNKASADIENKISAAQAELDERPKGMVASSLYDYKKGSRADELENLIKDLKNKKSALEQNKNLLNKDRTARKYGTMQDIPEFGEFSEKGAGMHNVDTSGTLSQIAESYERERTKEGFNNQNLVALFFDIISCVNLLFLTDIYIIIGSEFNIPVHDIVAIFEFS